MRTSKRYTKATQKTPSSHRPATRQNSMEACRDVGFGTGAVGSESFPDHIRSASKGQVTVRSNRDSHLAHSTHGTAQPRRPSAKRRHTTTAPPCLRRIHATTEWRGTPFRRARRSSSRNIQRSAQQRVSLTAFFTPVPSIVQAPGKTGVHGLSAAAAHGRVCNLSMTQKTPWQEGYGFFTCARRGCGAPAACPWA